MMLRRAAVLTRTVSSSSRPPAPALAAAPGLSRVGMWRRQAGTVAAGAVKRQRRYTAKFREKFSVPYTRAAPKGALAQLGEPVFPKQPIAERVFSAQSRPLDNPETKLGSRGSRRLRRAGLLPGVLYGGGPMDANPDHAVMVDTSEVERMVRTYGVSLENTVMRMMLDGEEVLVVPRQLKKHPVSEAPVHCNWMRLKGHGASKSNPSGLIRMDIPVEYMDLELSPAIKRGGYVNRIRWKLPCLVDPSELLGGWSNESISENLVHDVPTRLDATLKGFEVNERVRVSNFTLPPGVSLNYGKLDTYSIIANMKGKTMVEEVIAVDDGEEEVLV